MTPFLNLVLSCKKVMMLSDWISYTWTHSNTSFTSLLFLKYPLDWYSEKSLTIKK
jgi:hypothetical protein